MKALQSKNGGAVATTGPRKRVRWATALPKPLTPALVPYAKSRAELAGLDEGEITKLVLESEAWAGVMKPILKKLDAKCRERHQSGPSRSYAAEELESVLVFQRVCGLATVKEARDRLASDRHGRTRVLLGFDSPRKSANKVVRLTRGVPSEASICRHRTRFGEKRRLATYERLFARLVDEHLEDEAMRSEARILDLDGSHILTRFSSETPTSARKEGKVTCLDGGWMPPSQSSPWRTHGHGWNLVSLTTSTGLPLAKRVTKIQESERKAAVALFEGEFSRVVKPKLEGNGLSVLSADAGLHSPDLRRVVRGLGVVENISLASHGFGSTNLDSATKRDETRIPIQGHKDWSANGHRELVCRCGHGSISRVFKENEGKAIVRAEGRCDKCGSITITSGAWYLAKNAYGPAKPGFRRCEADDRARADLVFGNPLTFNDPLAKIYGSGRFGHQEGYHGNLVTRFGILDHKGWYRRKAQVEIEITMTFCVMHILAMEQRRLSRVQTARQIERQAA